MPEPFSIRAASPRGRGSSSHRLGLALVLGSLCAALPFERAYGRLLPAVTSSQSGQFVIALGEPTRRGHSLFYLQTDPDIVRLDPTLMPITCERIKQGLWREVGLRSPWRGKIFVVLYPADSDADPITIASERFRDGWQYRVALPDRIRRTRLVRAMVQVLLLEAANRNPGPHPAEIPAWLTEGLWRQVLDSTPTELVLAPPGNGPRGLRLTSTTTNSVLHNPLTEAHQRLSASPALSFQQLSWPTDEQLRTDPGEIFGCSAQLLVSQLLSFRDGRACLRAMLADLPRYYNWQLAFFNAFHQHFSDALDVEKWWALQLVNFTGRDLAQTWPAYKSWTKLDESIRSAVQVRTGTNELPLHVEVKLQTILREWDPERQVAALKNKLTELELLRVRLAPEFIPLLDDYRQALATFLQDSQHTGLPLPFRKGAVRRRALEQALQQLDGLDARLAKVKPKEPGKGTNLKPALAEGAVH